jgi:hypothetical protein
VGLEAVGSRRGGWQSIRQLLRAAAAACAPPLSALNLAQLCLGNTPWVTYALTAGGWAAGGAGQRTQAASKAEAAQRAAQAWLGTQPAQAT